MGLWENNLAASLTYQDLGDCSLGSIPAVTGLDDAREQEKEPVKPETKKEKSTVISFMKKAGGVFLLARSARLSKIL